MNFNTLKKYYYNSPGWIKTIYSKIPYSIRAGQSYLKWNRFLQKEFDADYPLVKLKETLFFAQEFIPYYKKLYTSLGVPGIELQRINEIQQIPFIDKEVVRKNFKDLVNKNCKSSFYVSTGGSSGDPMKFLQSKNVWAKEQAFVHSIFLKFDYSPSSLKASFRGAQFSNLKNKTYWHHNPIQNEIQFSPFHLNVTTISSYINEFNLRQPKYIQGYPSAIINFIRLASVCKVQLNTLIHGVFLISENFEKEDVELIKRFFNCRVLSFYGHSERLVIAPTIDEYAQVYEVDQRYGYFELISDSGIPVKNNKDLGEIVGTSFDNFSMPLIRYKTGDFTTYIDSDKNSSIKIAPIAGRWEREYLDGKNGEELTLTAINFHSDSFDGVNSYQFYQKEKGICELLLTASYTISKKQIEQIYKLVHTKIGHAINLEIRQIDAPLLTSRGKQKKLIKQLH